MPGRSAPGRGRNIRRTRRANNEGTVFKRKDREKWSAQVKVDGRTKTRGGFATREEAEEELARLQVYVTQSKLSASAEQTTAQYLATWLRRKLQREDVSPHSFRSYRSRLAHVVMIAGTIPLSELKPATIEGVYDHLLDQGLAPVTVRSIHVVLREALKDAVHSDLLARNPADRVKPPRAQRTEPAAITETQLMALLDASQGTRWYALWLVMGTTGIRIGEARALCWSDIDWTARELVIDEGATFDVDGKPMIGKTKNRRTRRVPLGDVALEALTAHRTIMKDECQPVFPQSFIVPAVRGGLLHRDTAARALERACVAAGIPRITPHVLRHTFATLFLMRGEYIKDVQRILGHASAQTTLDRYAAVMPDSGHDAMRRMDERLRASGV